MNEPIKLMAKGKRPYFDFKPIECRTAVELTGLLNNEIT